MNRPLFPEGLRGLASHGLGDRRLTLGASAVRLQGWSADVLRSEMYLGLGTNGRTRPPGRRGPPEVGAPALPELDGQRHPHEHSEHE